MPWNHLKHGDANPIHPSENFSMGFKKAIRPFQEKHAMPKSF